MPTSFCTADLVMRSYAFHSVTDHCATCLVVVKMTTAVAAWNMSARRMITAYEYIRLGYCGRSAAKKPKIEVRRTKMPRPTTTNVLKKNVSFDAKLCGKDQTKITWIFTYD